jgi:GNAT superfamily N-acetyltransferase
LKVRRIQKRDIAPALELVLKLFGDHPQFGSYVCDPLFVKMLKDEWTIDLTRSHPLAFVLEQKGRIVGQFDIYPHLATVFGRKTGSLGLNLHKSLQGRGLAKRIYLHLLKQMSRHRIHYFMGGTSQPGVMRLSKVMQRKAVGYELRSKKPAFPARYFLNY